MSGNTAALVQSIRKGTVRQHPLFAAGEGEGAQQQPELEARLIP